MRFWLLLFLVIFSSPVLADELEDMRSLLSQGDVEQIDQRLTARYNDYVAGKLSELDLHTLLLALSYMPRETASVLNSWVQKKPESGVAYLMRGYYARSMGWQTRGNRTYNQLNNQQVDGSSALLAAAYKDFSAADKLLGNCSPCKYGQINVAMYFGQRAAADVLLGKAIGQNPQAVAPVFAYVLLLAPQWGGHEGEQAAFLEKLATQQPDHPVLRMWQARELEQAGSQLRYKRMYGQAREILTQSVQLYPTAQAYYGLALCAKELKDMPAALDAVNKALRLSPIHDEARYLRSYIYLQSNKPDMALADLAVAADYGSNEAFGLLTKIYSGLEPGTQPYTDQAKARLLCSQAAQNGYSYGYLCMASNYYFGQNGYTRDIEQAVVWFTRAADAGVGPAMVDLGHILWNGEGIEANRPLACKYWRAAEQKGEARATQAIRAKGGCQAGQ